jgi:hypothetical protein
LQVHAPHVTLASTLLLQKQSHLPRVLIVGLVSIPPLQPLQSPLIAKIVMLASTLLLLVLIQLEHVLDALLDTTLVQALPHAPPATLGTTLQPHWQFQAALARGVGLDITQGQVLPRAPPAMLGTTLHPHWQFQ